jgi:hypothetical protein
MEMTDSGTLRSIVGPVEYRPSTYTNNGGSVPNFFPYEAPLYGVHHALLEGGKRDVLLIHDNKGIYVLDGWEGPGWRFLIAPSGTSAEVNLDFQEMDGRVRFPTQFVSTPTGVVIIPQGDRAYFYDGTTIAPLGFSEVPGPPTAIGPKKKSVAGQPRGVSDDEDLADDVGGFYKTGRNMNDVMGNNRCGSIRNDVVDIDSGAGKRSNALGGTRMEGAWAAKLQFVDHWGNLSAMSPQSTQIVVPKEDNLTKNRKKDEDEFAAALRVQFAWGDLDEGPEHCVARNLYRTRDQLNSGIPGYFWVAPISKGSRLVKATMASREQAIYPDNTPDNRLVAEAKEYVPVPIFRLATVCFGRLWIANTVDNPGLVRPSEPFFFGTFEANQEIYPDANGAEITGLLAINQGLLVFTETSTFLITQNDSGNAFKTAVLSTVVGCVAPNTARVLQNGQAVWLARDGFYSWGGSGMPQPVSPEIKDRLLNKVNKGWRRKAVAAVDPKMGEYRCWLPVDGSQENNLCLVYDGEGWRERDDVYAEAVCVTADHRQYMLALGRAQHINNHSSLWVLDHDGRGTQQWNGTRTSYVETVWLRNTRSQRRGTAIRAALWLRESTNGDLTIEVMRDWREYPRLTEVGEDPPNYAEDDSAPFWGVTLLDSTIDDELRDLSGADALPTHFVRRRPYWTKIDIMLPSIETFRIRITGTGDWEFIGLIFDEQDRHAGGSKLPLGD